MSGNRFAHSGHTYACFMSGYATDRVNCYQSLVQRACLLVDIVQHCVWGTQLCISKGWDDALVFEDHLTADPKADQHGLEKQAAQSL